jgi:aspartate carbamoyltransferase catalytic subunit
MLPPQAEKFGADVTYSLKEAVSQADVVMMLRIQLERPNQVQFPSLGEYTRFFGLTTRTATYLKKDAIVMHPGPMNRGVEISPDVADGPYSVILSQVTNGVAVRMAVLQELAGGN